MSEPPDTSTLSQVRRQPSLLVPLGFFAASVIAAIGLTVVYAVGGQVQLEGALLAVALGGIGAGIITWAKRFMPDELASEDRASPASEQGKTDDVMSQLAGPSTEVGRRNLLGTALAVALGGLGIAALLPLRSLGPRPGRGLKTTAFGEAGRIRLVDENGVPVNVDRLAVNSILTVFPEGHTTDEDAQTVLIRVTPDAIDPRPGREDWTVDGHIAYSKVCTHAGCPVGLYEEVSAQLLCPCHQSTFDVLDGAEPVFGPAARPLPQLPLGVDDDGMIVATGDFSAPVGPGFWDRDR